MDRARRNKTLSMDPEVWDAIEGLAAKQGLSVSRWVENYFFDHLQKAGVLAKDLDKLGERRGTKK